MDPEHQEQFPHNLTISLSPPTGNTTKYLQIIGKALKVDRELKPDQLTKEIQYDSQTGQLIVKFGCKELKLLRACATGFLRHMQLVAQTIKQLQNVE